MTFAAAKRCARRGPGRARHLSDRGRPRPRTSAQLFAGLAAGGRRSDRDRHAVLRPDGRRPGDPGAGLRALKAGMTLRGTLALVRALRRERRCDADRADGLLQPDLPLWRRGVCRRCGRGRGRRRHRRRSAARGGCRAEPAGARGRARSHPPGDADQRRRAPAG